MSESKGIWIWTSLSRPVFAVRNDSDQPIYQVRILGQAIEIAMVHAGSVRHATMMPEQAESFGFEQPLPGAEGPHAGPFPVAVEFSDAVGLRWVRDAGSVRPARG